MKTFRKSTVLVSVFLGLLSSAPAHATAQFFFSIYMPVIEGTEKAQLRKVSFQTNDSITETVVNAITWDPCEAEGQSSGCNAINPLKAANVGVNVYAYNGGRVKNPDGCYVSIDFSDYKPLPDTLRAALDTPDEQDALVQLAVKALQKTTRGKRDYVDCEIRIKGQKNTKSLGELNLPRYLNPVIPQCRPHTGEGRLKARSLNNKGMRYYRAGEMEKAAESFRRAAVEDCDYFLARTNLASVLSLQKKYDQSCAVLWRAIQLDRTRTMQKLAADPDYDGLKRSGYFRSALSPVGGVYQNYLEELKPGAKQGSASRRGP